jgi:predicted HTH domain antitoxin
MEIILRIPDDVAQQLSAAGGDVSRRALEALALQGYREQALSLFQVSEMLGLSRSETEDFLGQHNVPLSTITEADLNHEASIFDSASQHPRK